MGLDSRPIAHFKREHGIELAKKGQLYVGQIGIWMIDQRDWYVHSNGALAWETPRGANLVMRRYARHGGRCMLAPLAIDLMLTVGRRKIPEKYLGISEPDNSEGEK